MNEVRRRLLWALVVSAALHLALLFGAQIELPQPAPEHLLTVTLEPLPRPEPIKPAPARPRPAKPRPAKALPPPPEPSLPIPEPAPPATEAEPIAAPTEPELTVAEPPARPLTPLPKRIVIAYTIYKGEQKFNVGRMTHTWQFESNQYTLTSIAEASGLVSLFVRGALVQVSRGELTADGLKPSEFWIQRGQSGNRTESASFDWAGQLLRFGRANEQKTKALGPGTQDVLSVLYQLALTAPHSGTLELPVTNGRKFDRYVYRVVGEEMLETPLGILKTQHLSKVADAGEGGLDIWLAADYHYLPVRLHLTDKKGDTAEQIATSIGGE